MAKKKRKQETEDLKAQQVENAVETAENEGAEVKEEGAGQESESTVEAGSDLEKELEAARKRAEEASDQYIRLLAEFDNFRRRTRREMDSFREYASESVLKSLLPVLDDFDRTMTAMEKTDNLASLKEGVTMVADKLQKALAKEGLNLIEAKGEDFDSELHEAIHSMEVPDEKKGKVLEEVEKGYRLKDKVIRYSKVIVGE